MTVADLISQLSQIGGALTVCLRVPSWADKLPAEATAVEVRCGAFGPADALVSRGDHVVIESLPWSE